MPASSANSPARYSTRIVLSFACIYLVWGSTYLAMREGVEALPPFVLASTRYLVAAPILLGICFAKGIRIRPSWREFGIEAAIGILMLGCGNSAVIWCEQYLPSGLAALLVASVPLWAAVIEVFLPHGEGLSPQGWLGIAMGLVGILLLVWPGMAQGLHGGDHHQAIAAAVVLCGSFCWTLASVISRHTKVGLTSFAAAGWQVLTGGIFSTILMAFHGGYKGSHWGVQAFGSILYLVFFGSVLTYTAYLYLLDHVPVAKVATYAYINPMIAVILGAVILGERLLRVEYFGMAAILIAVFLVTSSKLKSGRAAAEVELAPIENQA